VTSASTLVAFDFDGTLAPIGDDPEKVRISRAAETLLNEVSALSGVVVAVASGRDVDDLAHRTRAPGAYLIGSHGLEIRGPGGTSLRDAPPLNVALDADLIRDIEAAGLRLERKKHAVALHWRGRRFDSVAGIVDRFVKWARSADLNVIEGRCVVEARCRGEGKEEALRWLSRVAGTSRVLYAGDDLTDYGALRFASENGRAVFVASAERFPPEGVTVVRSFRELFRLVRQEVLV